MLYLNIYIYIHNSNTIYIYIYIYIYDDNADGRAQPELGECLGVCVCV